MKKVILSICAFLMLAFSTSALDLTLRASPGALIPLNADGNMGFGGFLQADVDLFGFLTVGAEGQFNLVNEKTIDQKDFIYGGGIGLGAYYYPLSRLYVGAGGAFGIYQITTTAEIDMNTSSDLYWRGYGEIGFRFSPELTVSAVGGYNSYLLHETAPLLNGVNAGLGIRYTVPLGKKGSSSFITVINQDDAAFPLFKSAYRYCPFATVTIRNNEGAEIKNVRVSFRAGKYTSSTYQAASLSRIKKYGSVEVPLYADFSKEFLRFTENGKISGELVIDYEFLGKKKQVVQNAVISVYDRNSFNWSDSTALSCFISPDTPEIQEFAKYVAGIARNNFRTGMNRNFQIAAAMTDAIRLTGIKYSGDKQTPYTEYHLSDKLDSIQYPLQTINLGGGDYDDMGILLASCLESVGVPTGYLPLDDDFIVLVSAGVRPGAEANSFGNTKGLIVDDNDVYFGISMANLEKGFIRARAEASKKIAAVLAEENPTVEYTNVHAAWEVYSPCAFSENGAYFEKPGSGAITTAFNASVADYMNTDLSEVLARARKTNDSNKIGVALMRLGRYSEARAEFNKSGTISALNNLATVYMIEKSYSSAASTYKRVLEKDPRNKIALKGLENANAKLGY